MLGVVDIPAKLGEKKKGRKNQAVPFMAVWSGSGASSHHGKGTESYTLRVLPPHLQVGNASTWAIYRTKSQRRWVSKSKGFVGPRAENKYELLLEGMMYTTMYTAMNLELESPNLNSGFAFSCSVGPHRGVFLWDLASSFIKWGSRIQNPQSIS